MLRTQDKRLQLRRLEEVIPRYVQPQFKSYPEAGASTALITVTAHASANTKGATFTDIAASTAIDCDGFILTVQGTTAGVDMLFDIATGASTSETVILANVYSQGASSTNQGGSSIYVPLPVPAGTRISARAQGSTGGSVVHIGVTLVGAGQGFYKRLTRATNYGANTADSGGTGLDPGGSANTKPATFTEITAATTNPITALMVCIGNRANTAIASTPTLHMTDIATGAGGSEVVLINDIGTRATLVDDTSIPRWFGPFPVQLPPGVRLAARCQSSETNATDRLIDIILIGFD